MAAWAAGTWPAQAQTAGDPMAEVAELEKFFVNDDKPLPFASANVDFPRSDKGALPFLFFDAREIELSGAATLEGFLRQNLPMDASNASESQNMFLGGNLSSVNLRGIGENQTLVLINGRTAPPAFFGGSPDRFPQANVNNIPIGAVDRIEVLPAAASAIYGGNAAGGVVNLVLKRNFRGGQVRLVYQNPGDTDAPIRRVEMSYGTSLEGGRTRVMLFGSYSDQKLLQYQDRPFMRDYDELAFRISPSQNPLVSATPNIRHVTATSNLVLKNGGSIGSPYTHVPHGVAPGASLASLSAGLAANAGRYNLEPAAYSRQWKGGSLLDVGLGPRTKSFMLGIRREMTPRLELNADFNFSGEKHIRNTNLSVTAQRLPASAPTNPFTSDVFVYLPIVGDWTNASSNSSRQLTLGFVHQLPHEWRAQGDFTWNSVRLSYYTYTAAKMATAAINADLLAGRLQPLVDTSLYTFNLTPYQSRSTYDGSSASQELALRLAGPGWRLPGGPVQLGVALRHQREGMKGGEVRDNYPNYSSLNVITSYLGRNQAVGNIGAEARVPIFSKPNRRPLVRELELQLAARADWYDVRTGTPSVQILPVPAQAPVIRTNRARYHSVNPTVALSYCPVAWLQFRGGYSRAFSSPRYNQLAEDPTVSGAQVSVVDPRRGNVTIPVYYVSGGNSELQPERVQAWHGGLVVEPESGVLRGLRLAVDYNFFRKQNAIERLSQQQIVDFEASYPDRVRRGSVSAGDPFGVGPIELVDISLQNLYKSWGDTFDVSLGYRRATAQFGTFELKTRGSFGNHHKRKVTPYFEMIEFANVNPSGSLPITAYGPLKFQGSCSLTWDYRRFTVRWTTRYFCSYRVPAPPIAQLSAFVQSQGGEFVAAQAYSDLLLGYRFPVRDTSAPRSWVRSSLDGLELHVGVDNLFNHIPPYDYSTPFNFSQRGNARLRDYRLMIKKPF